MVDVINVIDNTKVRMLYIFSMCVMIYMAGDAVQSHYIKKPGEGCPVPFRVAPTRKGVSCFLPDEPQP